jgi:hypothetical protein
MARLSMTTPHTLGRDEARRRLKEKLDVVRAKYGHQASDLREAWGDYSLSFGFKARGMTIDGTMDIDDAEVRLAADVPFAVVLFKRTIENRIRAELGTLLT